jgi:hypothetical protein
MTLKTLSENGIPPESVDVFLSSQEEVSSYRHINTNLIYSRDLNGVVEKFNFIHNYYPPGTRVVVLEDDITELKSLSNGKLVKFTALPKLADECFAECDRNKTKLWGVSSNANPFYMKDGISVGLKFIVANVFGFISTNDPFLEVSLEGKSDYERTCLYYTVFKNLVRADGICAITKNYKTPGGMQEDQDRRAEIESKACESLVKRFPHLVSHNIKKSSTSMYQEVRIKQSHKSLFGCDLLALQRNIDASLK